MRFAYTHVVTDDVAAVAGVHAAPHPLEPMSFGEPDGCPITIFSPPPETLAQGTAR
ncbi:hypothetical protein [Sphingomonas morindae]|uniref:Uncharacterized protein n=1 Tax=Sphingomonas morindae TaxID=1541170 RepID=A0ABY4XCH1_9SPHN|nr:hypothetical protein [Sphingomonas morindae]USI74652.1 hypothetical protein LHA26_18035 [Sphingomonas morindae]